MANKYQAYIDANKAFVEKYEDIIFKIADLYGVDMGVGTDMLKSNLEFDKTIYNGGGVVPTDEWNEMVKDYWELKNIAIELVEKDAR